MKMLVFGTNESPFTFGNALIKREWMNETFDKHAYRCVPLTSANTYGWEVRLPQDVVVIKDDEGKVSIIEGQFFKNTKICSTDILNESVAFLHNITFHTEQNYSILVSGPPNHFIDGAQAYTAIIPSSWWLHTFQFSWRITKTDCPILFEKNKPIMFVTLIQNTLLSETDVKIENNQSEQTEIFKANYSQHSNNKKMNGDVWLSTMRGNGTINGIEFNSRIPQQNPQPPKRINENDSI